ncbi:MAG TPA: DivIVA domain-containing protein [Mycobacteriales bacterium]
MTTLLTYVFGLLLVGGLLFLVASFAFGRGEEMVPALPEGTPVELPDDRPADGADLRELRLSVVLRGYRMDEVDWLLDRLAEQIDARDREIARLRSVLHVEPVQVGGERSEPDQPPGDGERR